MAKKITIIITLLFTIFVSFPVVAATDNTSNIPETNPFCWKKIDCQKQRRQFGTSDDKSGFITGAAVAPCVGGTGDDEWGRCLPAGTSKTEISFGGKSEFSNIGDFIITMYKYLLTIASIVAVVVIIIAGAQWITSGGNSEAIGSAKKRIGGAVIGLFIAYMSYFVLNTINPALVNLRLPQVWLVKPISLTPEFCSQLEKPGEGKLKFMHAAGGSEQAKPVTLETADGKAAGFNLKLTDKNVFNCGERFFGESAGKTPCMGDSCPYPGQTCYDSEGKRTDYKCGDVRIGGTISYLSVAAGLAGGVGATIAHDWADPPIKDAKLVVVCKDEQTSDLTDASNSGKVVSNKFYTVEATISMLESKMHHCDDEGGFNGFALQLEMDRGTLTFNEYHFIGKNGVDLGYDAKRLTGSNFFSRKGYRVDSKYLFTLDDLKVGVRLPIDANSISWVGKGESDFDEIYKKYWRSGF